MKENMRKKTNLKVQKSKGTNIVQKSSSKKPPEKRRLSKAADQPISKGVKNNTSAGHIAYTETNSFSTQPMSGNLITDIECKSIEDAIASEVLKEMRLNSKVFRTLEAPSRTSYTRKQKGASKTRSGMSKSRSDIRLMSFKDLRQLQKVASESMVGPGTYNMPIEKQKNISFGRRTFRKMEKNPGPGTYDSDASKLLHTQYSTKAFKILGKAKEQEPEFITGPGDYDQNQIKIGKGAPQWSMQHKREQSYSSSNPAVGQYNVQDSYNQTQKSNLGATMKARQGFFMDQQLKFNNVSPGPAMYQKSLLNFGKTGRTCLVRGKPKPRSLNRNPGPGTYELKFKNQENRVQSLDIAKFSKRPSIVRRRNGTPPVGSYNIDKGMALEDKGKTMGLKRNWKPDNENPGPGIYNPNKEVTLQGFNAMMKYEGSGSRERLVFPSYGTDEQVSVANYNPGQPFGLGGMNKTFGKKLKQINNNKNPGPGQYKPCKSYTERNSANPLITQSLRERPDREKRPDAGMYQNLQITGLGKGAPQWSIANKLNEINYNCNPSPLDYNPGYKLVQRAAPGTVMRQDQMVWVDVSKYLHAQV